MYLVMSEQKSEEEEGILSEFEVMFEMHAGKKDNLNFFKNYLVFIFLLYLI